MNIKTLPISKLKAADYNPRQSTKKQEAALSESLKKFGIVEPIIYNERTGCIVGGHFRVRELRKLGHKEVPCVVVDLSLEDERELNIRLNANTGGWDWDEMANNFDMNELEDWGLELPFDSPEDMEGEIKDEEIQPYENHHILISFHPDLFLDVKPLIEELIKIEGVKYEQSNN